MSEQSRFRDFGFLSDAAYANRASLKTDYSDSAQTVFERVRTCLNDLDQVKGACLDVGGVQNGLLLWIRSIEASQGAIHLADLGMPGTANSSLRTAFECLFYACALWRKPALNTRLFQDYVGELQKMASKVLPISAEHNLDPETVDRMNAIVAEPKSKGELSAHDAAEAADLLGLYQTAYRGLSSHGAHATWGSTGTFRNRVSPQGNLVVGPDFAQTELIWRGAHKCLRIGSERFKSDCLPQIVPPPTPK